MPYSVNPPIILSMTVFPFTGINGFGRISVKGARRVPLPPAITINGILIFSFTGSER